MKPVHIVQKNGFFENDRKIQISFVESVIIIPKKRQLNTENFIKIA